MASLGSLLLAAAILKSHALWTGAEPTGLLFTSPRSQFALILIELFLGVWLLSGWLLALNWLTAFAAFTCMTAASTWHVASRQASCGCFGVVAISPVIALVIDVIAIVLLAMVCPVADLRKSFARKRLSQVALKVLGCGLACCAILGIAIAVLLLFVDPSLSIALAKVRGDDVAVDPDVIDLGVASNGDLREFEVRVRNLASTPIRIYGGTSNCQCTATKDLPMTLSPHAAEPIRIILKCAGANGRFERRIILLADGERKHEQLNHLRMSVTPESRS